MRNPFIRPGVVPEDRLATALVSLLAGYSAYRDSRRVHRLYAPKAVPTS